MYKRQALGTGEVASIAIITALTVIYTFEGGLAAVIWTDVVQTAIYVGGTLAVSYTHLDVYKRQLSDWRGKWLRRAFASMQWRRDWSKPACTLQTANRAGCSGSWERFRWEGRACRAK